MPCAPDVPGLTTRRLPVYRRPHAIPRRSALHSGPRNTGGDLVYQGMQTMNALAASLIDAESWFFWWD